MRSLNLGKLIIQNSDLSKKIIYLEIIKTNNVFLSHLDIEAIEGYFENDLYRKGFGAAKYGDGSIMTGFFKQKGKVCREI